MSLNLRYIFWYSLLTAAAVIGELVHAGLGDPRLMWAFKPLLVPLLLVYLSQKASLQMIDAAGLPRKTIYAALLFSWAGDILLMFSFNRGATCFLAGLAAFFLVHLCYMRAFQTIPRQSGASVFRSRPYAALPVLLFFAGMIYILHVHGNAMFFRLRLPVVLYGIALSAMVLFALNRQGRVPQVSYHLVTAGGLLFLFSDALIALREFTHAFRESAMVARVLITVSYAAAQWLIIQGLLEQAEVKQVRTEEMKD